MKIRLTHINTPVLEKVEEEEERIWPGALSSLTYSTTKEVKVAVVLRQTLIKSGELNSL